MRGKLKEGNKFKCQICENQEIDIAEDCQGTRFNEQSLENVEKFCYLDNKIEAGEDVFDSVITTIMSGWCSFRDLVPLLASRCLNLGVKDRLHSACVHKVMPYGSKTWSVKEEDIIE